LDATDSKLEKISDRLNFREKQDFRTPLFAKERIPPATEVFGKGTTKPFNKTSNIIWDDVTSKRELDVPTMIFECKTYDGVRMDELKVGKVLKFIDDVNR
jgi:hypothetical protein